MPPATGLNTKPGSGPLGNLRLVVLRRNRDIPSTATRKQLITFTANMQTSLIGMEACSGAHFLGRALREQGHDVNPNHNPDLKNLFKSASAVAALKAGPFQKFYAALIRKGIKPEMARLTLARKIAAITLCPSTPRSRRSGRDQGSLGKVAETVLLDKQTV
jgi:hypothetical protein